jgi:hypothetical protein
VYVIVGIKEHSRHICDNKDRKERRHNLGTVNGAHHLFSLGIGDQKFELGARFSMKMNMGRQYRARLDTCVHPRLTDSLVKV